MGISRICTEARWLACILNLCTGKMATNRRGSAKRTSSDTSAAQSSTDVEDAPGPSTTYTDPTEPDLEQVMADLMSNDLPFSVRSR